MQFIKPGININFIGVRKIAFIISVLLILVSIISLAIHKGPKYGVDFAGGTLIQVKFSSLVNIKDIRSGLDKINLESSVQQFGEDKDNEYQIRTNKLYTSYTITEDSLKKLKDKGVSKKFIADLRNLKDQKYKNEDDFINALIKTIGTDQVSQYKSWILRHTKANEELAGNIKSALKTATGNEPVIRNVNMVGPQVSKDLKEKALFAMFFALLFITIYISGRFELQWLKSGGMVAGLIFCIFSLSRFNLSIPILIFTALIITLILFWFLKLKYAMGAIVALIHDVTITVGVFSIFNKEFDLPIIAALLTIIGYSLNDTIIVYDRIRENLRKHHKNPLDFILNKSINETLNRTLLTSVTTLVVVISLFVLGGGVIHDFAFALIVGILTGTYSSVYVASPILLSWHEFEKKK